MFLKKRETKVMQEKSSLIFDARDAKLAISNQLECERVEGEKYMKRNRKRKIWIAAGIICFLIIMFGVYVNDYYHSEITIEEAQNLSDTVEITSSGGDIWLDGPGENDIFIFYPGAKVEYTSYLPLLTQVAENGIDCVLVKMPCNLAFFGINKAQDYLDAGYGYTNWYIGGHSLGGAMAAYWATGHLDELSGLVLLAAYPTKSLQAEGFFVVSIYGSEDHVLNFDKVESGRDFMPEDYTEICITGGNHAQFGDYGVQDGDGTATISREEQISKTAEAIVDMVENEH